MAKRKKMTEEERAAIKEARVLEVCEDLESAKAIAAKMFKVESVAPQLLGDVYDRLVVGAETDEDKAQDLLKAREVARELFGVGADGTPSPEVVFMVFDRIDEVNEDDEDEEKDE